MLFIPLTNLYSKTLTLRCEIKYYDELKGRMEAIQQIIVENTKNVCANALKKVKCLYKEFGFTDDTLKGSLAKGRSEK